MSDSRQNQDRLRVQRVADQLFELAGQAGFSPILLDALQPADIFIDLSGEDLRHRLCLIEREGGSRLCLRPDFTIPTGLNYIAGLAGSSPTARKLAYAGPVYRRQANGAPQEITQVGVESFGDPDREMADAQIMSFALEAIAAIGIKHQTLLIGDLGLFAALLGAIEMPKRWRRALCRAIWRPAKFDALLTRISRKPEPDEGRDAILASIGGLPKAEARAVVAGLINDNGGDADQLPPGGRSVEEITARLMARAEDARATPLSGEKAALIRQYLKVSGPPGDALAAIRNLSRAAGLDITPALERFARRLELLEARGVAIGEARFSAEFGRALEYYTGFVFEITGEAGQTLAGGGRYDTLLEQLGLDAPVPAVGCALKVPNLIAGEGRP